MVHGLCFTTCQGTRENDNILYYIFQLFTVSDMGTNRQLGVRFAEKGDIGVPGLLTDLQSLLHDTDTSDVVFVVGKDAVEFHAHRLILWAR